MKRSLSILFWVIPFLSIAQTSYRSGYLITNSQDTLRGFISFKEESENPTAVYYRPELNAKTQVFPLKDCKAYVVENFYSYRRETVSISRSNDDINKLSTLLGLDSSSKKEEVFLRILQSGENVSLFMYTDDIKSRFYIQSKEDPTPVELIRNVFYKERGVVSTENKFQVQLYLLMQKYKKNLTPKDINLEWVGYNANDLIKVVSKMNNQSVVESRVKDIRFFIGGGLSTSSFAYKGSHPLANAIAESKKSYKPMITIGVDYIPKPLIGKMVYRVDATLFLSKNEITQKLADLKHSFDELTVAITPQVIYNIYNSNSIKFYAGAGVAANFSSYSNNLMSALNEEGNPKKNDVDFSAFSFSPKITAGFVINKKIEFSGGYYLKGRITDYQAFKVDVSRLSIGVNYLIK
nr:outer membrane beta-barrel protein [Pedobacter panaciterrae]